MTLGTRRIRDANDRLLKIDTEALKEWMKRVSVFIDEAHDKTAEEERTLEELVKDIFCIFLDGCGEGESI